MNIPHTLTLQENASSGDESDPGSPAHSAQRRRHPSTPSTPTRRVSPMLTHHTVPPSSPKSSSLPLFPSLPPLLPSLPPPPPLLPSLQIPTSSPSPSSRLAQFRPTTPQRTPHPKATSLVPSASQGLKGKRSISASTPDMRANGKPGERAGGAAGDSTSEREGGAAGDSTSEREGGAPGDSAWLEKE